MPNQAVHAKTTGLHVALRAYNSGTKSGRELFKGSRHDKSSSLHSKKHFWLGGAVFCEWRHKWRTFRPPWPTLPGPGLKPLDSSISLKFLLETRLQSESFDALDDLMGFRVQKLWSKAGFLRCFRDPVQVPRIRENRVPTGAYWVAKIFLKKPV